MNYTVLWRPVAEQRLAELWTSASDRNAVTQAAHAIDEALRTGPERVGESRMDDVRILFEKPLGALFTVSPDDRMVYVVRGTLIASSVFAFALAYLLTGRGSRPFLVGFLAAGLFTELAYWVCCWAAPWQVLAYAQHSVDEAVFGFYFDNFPGFYQALLQGSPSARLFFDMTCFPLIVTIHSLPLLSVAVLGGWASKRRATRFL